MLEILERSHQISNLASVCPHVLVAVSQAGFGLSGARDDISQLVQSVGTDSRRTLVVLDPLDRVVFATIRRLVRTLTDGYGRLRTVRTGVFEKSRGGLHACGFIRFDEVCYRVARILGAMDL